MLYVYEDRTNPSIKKGTDKGGMTIFIAYTVFYKVINREYKRYIFTVDSYKESETYQEACMCLKWTKTMNEEIKALE